jgi:WD40 repeat protein
VKVRMALVLVRSGLSTEARAHADTMAAVVPSRADLIHCFANPTPSPPLPLCLFTHHDPTSLTYRLSHPAFSSGLSPPCLSIPFGRWVRSVAFLPNGTYIASISDDMTIRTMERKNGRASGVSHSKGTLMRLGLSLSPSAGSSSHLALTMG